MSGQPIPIYQGRDFYIPQFLVKVGDRALDREVINDIISVNYRDNIKEFDSFEISLSNWDSEARDFKYSDENLFLPGKRAELWMGYRGGQESLRLMLKGEITSLRPTFPAGGQPTLTISGKNLLHRFQKRQESHAYPGMKDSAIARQIAGPGRLGVHIDTDPNAEAEEQEHSFLFQHNQYDIIFLMERAQRIGYELIVVEAGENGQSEESRLYFGPPQNAHNETYKLEYGKSLIEFQPTLTVGNQVAQVTVRGWNPIRSEVIEETVTRENIDNQGVGEEGDQQEISRAFSERQEIIADQPIESREEARTLARSTLENIAREMVKGSGSTLGLPNLRAGRYLQIEGLGKRFSGRYFVTATAHSIGADGYKTQFECRREESRG